MRPSFEQLSNPDFTSDFAICYRCRKVIQTGEMIEFITIQHLFRWPKQKKKAKGNTDHTHKQHVGCPK